MESEQEILILAVLSEAERYGYEIDSIINRRFRQTGRRIALSSIYAVLTRLYNDGLVSMREVSRSGRPPRKLYGLTFSGRERLEKCLFDIATAGYEGIGRFEYILIAWPILTSEQRRNLVSAYYIDLEEIRKIFQKRASEEINQISAAIFERYAKRVASELNWLEEFSQRNDIRLSGSD
jgi:DNA-binding PadR family transcriptional regulator